MKTLMIFVNVFCLWAIICIVTPPAAGYAQQTQENQLDEGDFLQIAVQKICPVMGVELGSMGTPIKVRIGDQKVYLCCASCVGKEVNKSHWKTIQNNIANAQVNCPIMGMPVDASKESTVVDGRKVFVCCPPCIDKIQANADSAIAKVNIENERFVSQALAKKNDRLQASAQKICPVSGRPLGEMNSVVKVQVGEQETAFLCSNGCTEKQIDAQLWRQVQKNLAMAQRLCPVMEQAVDASMDFVVIDGRKIFVCCPPCIDKIKEAPKKFTLKLNHQVTENVGKVKK